MGLAEQIQNAAPQVPISDIISKFVKDNTDNEQASPSGAENNNPASELLSVEDVAKAMALIASSTSGSPDEWSAEEFARGVCTFNPRLSWDDIIYKLPSSGIDVHSEAGVEFIVNAYLAATTGQGKSFPCGFMYEIWPDPHTQVAFLRFALHSNKLSQFLQDKQMPTVTSEPLDALYLVYSSEFSRMLASPWNSLSLILALSHLLDSSAGDDARALLDYGCAHEPVLVTLALARLKVQHIRLQTMLQQNVAGFLRRDLTNRSLFFELFRIIDKKVMLAFLCSLQRREQSFARPILDVLVELGIVNELILTPKHDDIMMLDMIIELAVFASRRGYIVFETWFPSLLSELGNDMLHVSLEILHSKIQLEAARQRGEDAGTMAYTLGELTTMFKALGSVSMSPNNTANLKALYIQLTELAGKLELAENEYSTDDKRIENDAETLFLRLYRGELTIDKMINILRDLRDSLRIYMRKTYAHVVQYPLEEFSFFANYPEKELTITGKLVGEFVRTNLLSPSTEPAVLDMLVRALQSQSTSNTFLFGTMALHAFQERFEQLPIFCSSIYQIPAIRQGNEPASQLLQTIFSNSSTAQGMTLASGKGPVSRETNSSGGDHQTFLSDVANANCNNAAALVRPSEAPDTIVANTIFRSVNPSPIPSIEAQFSEPTESVKDKIQFAVNNLAPSNLSEKTGEVDKVLFPENFLWFSQEIIVKRASQEPNYHNLYLQFVNTLDRPALNMCILRETLVSISRLLNAESTINSSRDRGYLKNLGSWLGGITLARNQPILRENVSFKDLLCEGYESGRLIVAIPFVCKVLEQASRSAIFHPPNPWLMSIMSVLSELYITANLKLNLTFEIEVLCKALNLDVKGIAPSSLLSDKTRAAIDGLAHNLGRAAIGSSGGAASGVKSGSTPVSDSGIGVNPYQMPVLNGSDITVDILGVLAQHASFHAADALFSTQPSMKKVFYMLTERMIREIIPIHVARSIYVAVSCTRDTILKDFCGEPNEDNVHRAAQVMARGLAGALAVSLCREQLKSKLYLTMREFLISHSVPEQSANNIAVGLVADNLDLACAIAEKESIERASVQIDTLLNETYSARKRMRERTGQPFYDMARYSRLVYPADFPEILKVRLNGLQPGHLRVYEDFTQIPHFFSQIHNSVGPGNPATTSTVSRLDRNEEASPADVSGINDSIPKLSPHQCFEKFANIISDLDKIVAAASPNITLSSLPAQHEACLYARDIIVLAVRSISPEDTAMDFAQTLVNYLYRTESRLGIDLYVLLLARMCEMSERVAKEVTNWLVFADDERKYNVHVTIALINERLISLSDEDDQLSIIVESGRQSAIVFASQLLKAAIIERATSSSPQAFSKTIQAFVKLAQSNRAPSAVTSLLEELKHIQSSSESRLHKSKQLQESDYNPLSTIRDYREAEPKTSEESAGYQQILLNWTRVYIHPAAGEAELATLARQLQQQLPLQSDIQVAASFFRTCIDSVFDFYDQSVAAAQHSNAKNDVSANTEYHMADALVRLVIFLMKYSEQPKGTDGTMFEVLRIFLSGIALEAVKIHSADPDRFSACQKPLFRLLSGILYELNLAYRAEESWYKENSTQILGIFGEALLHLSPSFVPGFSFAWLMLASHRHFFPRLMSSQDLWGTAARLIEVQFTFLEPFISSGQITNSLKLLYRGTVCVILVVLHDYPEFLSKYAPILSSYVPISCVKLRNLILSAYPREMQLPEPLTPNLEISSLPDIKKAPPVPPEYAAPIVKHNIAETLVDYLAQENTSASAKEIATRLSSILEDPKGEGAYEKNNLGHKVQLINSIILHIIVTVTSTENFIDNSTSYEAAIDILQAVLLEASPETCYLLINVITNQLRFPSSHTYIGMQMILDLFVKGTENVREYISRILIERILVNRPFPWGLLVTLIELLRGNRYNFWSHDFTTCSPQIVEILSAVAKSIHPLNNDATSDASAWQQVAIPNTNISIENGYSLNESTPTHKDA